MADSEVLTAPHVLTFPYQRSVGPVLGAFFEGLRHGRILGARGAGGRVAVPPAEYDPVTGEDSGELVEVGPAGVVSTWGWASAPSADQPPGGPFAWALVLLDGADTAMLHVVRAAGPEAMATGMRVVARFRPAGDRAGHIRDIECFVPEGTASRTPGGATGAGAAGAAGPGRTGAAGTADAGRGGAAGPVGAAPGGAAGAAPLLSTPISIDYRFTAGQAQSRWLEGLARGRFIGQRCPDCGKVYVPPRGSCPTDGVPTTEDVELGNTGTVTTYCVVNVPFAGQQMELPYICAQILLDGANLSFMGLIQEIPPDQVRMGLRVEAVWKDPVQWGHTLENVRHFRPTGEPDAAYETFEEYL